MIRKIVSIALVFTMAVTVFLFSGCGGGDLGIEKIDPTRTQLYVGLYNGGFGDEWARSLKARFEAFKSEAEYEPGKKGVQIMIESDKSAFVAERLLNTIKTSTNEVFFGAGDKYHEFVTTNSVMDITDIVEENLLEKYGEDKTIEDKISKENQDYLKRDGKYYGVPATSSAQGIIYDVDLFDQRKLFISDSGGSANLEGKLSAGPDGQANTYDDGLPATFKEFFNLCVRMKGLGITPLSWSGVYSVNYSRFILNAIWADYEGLDKASLVVNMGAVEGKDTADIITGFDSAGNPIIGSVKITEDNYKLLAKQPGRYYALKFWEEIVQKSYYSQLSTNISQTHVMAQADYLSSKFEGEPIAMLIEGAWWENEATEAGTFADMEDLYGSKAAKRNRRFAFMPMPNATEAEYQKKVSGEKNNTLFTGGAQFFINANITEQFKKDLAKDFLQFSLTDDSLNDYTLKTGIKRALDYELTEATESSLSYFSKSFLELDDNSDKYNAQVKSPAMFQKFSGHIESLDMYYSKVKDAAGTLKTQNVFLNALRIDKISARDYFEGIYTYLG